MAYSKAKLKSNVDTDVASVIIYISIIITRYILSSHLRLDATNGFFPHAILLKFFQHLLLKHL
jgi:hypothetical protein